LIDRPRPTDAVSLVQFDHRHAGWREGADTLADVGRLGLRRVILLSDGQAHQGLTDPAAIAAQCAE
jgi:Ca-activated chloride channel family protein